MISQRYLPWLILLFLVALVPTVIHQYLGLKEDDGLRTEKVPEQLAGYHSQPTERRRAWGMAMFGSHDWFERDYVKNGRAIRLFVGRGYDQKRLYHHPEIALSRGADLQPETLLRLADGTPVHLMREKDGTGVAAYVLLYDDRFLQYPVKNQLLHAAWQLFHPRRALTLFYVADPKLPRNAPFPESDAARLLQEAIRRFRE